MADQNNPSNPRFGANFTGHPAHLKAAAKLIGRKIVNVRWMSKEEAADAGWSNLAPVLELDDGTAIFPQSDDEGNDGGALGGTAVSLPTLSSR
jgi:hypothetical protein